MRKKILALACASAAGLAAAAAAGGLAFSIHAASMLEAAAAGFGTLSGAHGASAELRPGKGGLLSRRGEISLFLGTTPEASFKYEGSCLPFAFTATLTPRSHAASDLLARAGASSLELKATPAGVLITTGSNDAAGLKAAPLIDDPRWACDATGLEASAFAGLSELRDLEKIKVRASAASLRCYISDGAQGSQFRPGGAQRSFTVVKGEFQRSLTVVKGEFETQAARIAEAGWKIPPYFSYKAASFENSIPQDMLGGPALPAVFSVRALSGTLSRLPGGKDGFATKFDFGKGVLSNSVKVSGTGDRITGPEGQKGVKRGSYAIAFSGPAFRALPQLPDLVKAGYVKKEADYRWSTRLDIERRMDAVPPTQVLRLNGIKTGSADWLAFLMGGGK